jgi:hypothetical protein
MRQINRFQLQASPAGMFRAPPAPPPPLPPNPAPPLSSACRIAASAACVHFNKAVRGADLCRGYHAEFMAQAKRNLKFREVLGLPDSFARTSLTENWHESRTRRERGG